MKSITEEPFHAGEQAVQERFGVRARLQEIGPRLMRTFLTDEHRAFFPQLDFVVVGVVDEDGRPRATIVDGGAQSPTPKTLSFALPAAADPAAARMNVGAPIAVLGLQPHTRRRNRANGVVGAGAEGRVVVDVRATFGNCPKYIAPRRARRAPKEPAQTEKHSHLTASDVEWIRGADTFFIASAHVEAGDDVAAHGVDVSHRGGPAGFVGVASGAEGDVLWVPDYQGNFYFNTLGNLEVNPHAGLVFVRDGDLLQLSVDVDIVWEEPRAMKMRVTDVVRVKNAVALRLVD